MIFWYNCDLLSESACADLKAQIKDVMAGADNFKVIAFPWPSLDVPVVMTSWGRLMKMESFDSQKATAFVETFRGKAPEPELALVGPHPQLDHTVSRSVIARPQKS